MSLQERTPSIFTTIHGHSHGPSIPKSILTDKSHHLFAGIENNSNLRVTFAKTPQAKQFASSLASFHQNMYPNNNLKPGTSPPLLNAKSPVAAAEEMNRKLLFHSQDEDINAKTHTSTLQVNQVSHGAERVRRAYQLGKYKKGGGGGVDVLFPDKKAKPKSMTGSLSGVLSLGKTESDDSIGKKSRASVQSSTKSKSRPKKLSRKPTNKSISSNTSRKVKSGKKLKRRKKSKIDEELEKELTKPPVLNEEYKNELDKITQILKAVTAFDESTATKNGVIVTGTGSGSASGRNNANAFYTYAGGSDSDTGRSAISSSTTKSLPRRPLSGDELKQLLSSITRVVSLHQLPIDVNAAKTNGSLMRLGTTTNATPPTTLKESEVEKAAKAPVSDPLGTSSVVSTSTTKSGKKKKRKKSKRVQPKYPTEIQDVNTEPRQKEKERGKSATSAVNIKSKSKGELARKTKSKSKTTAQSTKPRIDGGSSNSSLEKDPVKHAQFLRKYFEESVRLLNKNSSEDLIAAAEAAKTTPAASAPVPNATPTTTTAPTATAVEEKPKKKVKKKKSVSKKDG